MKQLVRDTIKGDLTLDYFAKRLAEGWAVASIEWVRESDEATTPQPAKLNLVDDASALPFGLRVSEGGFLEENPLEAAVLLLILEQIVQERRITEIAHELNTQHYLTRHGTAWTPTDVFNLLPRLIDAGPSLLKSAAWEQRRRPN